MRLLLSAAAVSLLCACSEQPAAPPPTAAPSGTQQGFKVPVLGPPAGQSTPFLSMPAAATVKVTYQRQQGDNLCWAAVTAMVLEAGKVTALQCEQAERRHKVPTPPGCCPDPSKSYCDIGSTPGFDLYSKHPKRARTISQAELVQEIGTAGRPFVFRINFDHGLNHFFVAYGFRYDQNGKLMVAIYDPASGSGSTSGTFDFDDIITGNLFPGTFSEVFYEVY